MKAFLLLLPVLSLASAHAAVLVTSGSLNALIPDDTDTGIVHSLVVADSFNVGAVRVSLNLSVAPGDYGWTGDLYAYLQHGSALSVLLNRPGRTDASTAAGYGDNQSIEVTFDNGAANGDIRLYRTTLLGSESSALAGPLTGAWQPDGRTTDPISVLLADPRDASLDQFNGLDSGGTWTLFVADLSGGGQFQLDSWSLELAGIAPVPEPAVTGAGISAALLGLALWLGNRLRRAGLKVCGPPN